MEYFKVYVAAKVLVDERGSVRPLSIFFEGRELPIDKITYVCTAPPEHVGGLVTRKYSCRIRGKDRDVYVDIDGRWFVEARR